MKILKILAFAHTHNFSNTVHNRVEDTRRNNTSIALLFPQDWISKTRDVLQDGWLSESHGPTGDHVSCANFDNLPSESQSPARTLRSDRTREHLVCFFAYFSDSKSIWELSATVERRSRRAFISAFGFQNNCVSWKHTQNICKCRMRHSKLQLLKTLPCPKNNSPTLDSR